MEDLVQAGYLRTVPVDPRGQPYRIVRGRVQVSDYKKLPFITKGLPPGEEPDLLQNLPKSETPK
jgi:hypothetical protein